ncbi:MAG TPA: serine hydrolase, partial [Anaerolineales bacterium]|nr:serine hydrolase [Anaerolineales bacterium]
MDSLQRYISQFKDQLIGVAVYDLQMGEETLLHAEETMHPASTIKVHVMMEVFHQAAQGRFSMDDEI